MYKEKFFNYIQYEKRFSPHTLTAYKNDLSQFFNYIQASYSISEIAEITSPLIRSWIVSLMDSGINPRSVNRKITTLKTFYKFLMRENRVQENPMFKIQAPKTSKRLPVFVEEEKMHLLFDEIPFKEGLEGKRDRLIFEFFYKTGVRLAELINLKENDINFGNSTIKVLGKRSKERIIPIGSELKNNIQQYISLKKQQDLMSPQQYLLLTNKGSKLYEKFVYRLINNYLSQVTTLSKKSPHVLRHTFATHMLNKGANINTIKELLGHANLSATQIYTHNTIEKLKTTHKKAHPREKKT